MKTKILNFISLKKNPKDNDLSSFQVKKVSAPKKIDEKPTISRHTTRKGPKKRFSLGEESRSSKHSSSSEAGSDKNSIQSFQVSSLHKLGVGVNKAEFSNSVRFLKLTIYLIV